MKAITKSDRGSGAAVVYVPGIDGTGELLLATAGRIEEQFRLLRLAYEDEGMPGSAELYERIADTVAERMEDAGIESGLILAESFGGGVAIQLALRHPGRVKALMLVNTFAYYPRRIRIRLGAALVPFTPRKLLRLGRVSLAGKLFFRPRKDPEAEGLFKKAIPGFARGGYATRMKAIPHLDLRGRLAEVQVPAALYCSSHDAVVPSKSTMKVLSEGLGHAEFHMVLDANHIILPLREEPWVQRLEDLEERGLTASSQAPSVGTV